VRGLEPGVVHRPLDRVDGAGLTGGGVEGRTAGMPGERQREDVVATLERRQHELPRPPGVHEPVQADHRRAAAAAMSG